MQARTGFAVSLPANKKQDERLRVLAVSTSAARTKYAHHLRVGILLGPLFFGLWSLDQPNALLCPASCLISHPRYDQQQMRKLMMKSYEGTEALERRRKQVQSRETGLESGVVERGSRFPFARRRARRRHEVVSRSQVPTTVVSKCCSALEFPIMEHFDVNHWL